MSDVTDSSTPSGSVAGQDRLILELVRCNDAPNEGEWGEWYDDEHLRALVDNGADTAARFEIVGRPQPGMPTVGFSHLTVCELGASADLDARTDALHDYERRLASGGVAHPNHALVDVWTVDANRGAMAPASSAVTGRIFVFVFCNDPRREAEWDAWYDAEHVPDMMATGVFAAASRWTRRPPAPWGPNHLTLYDLAGPSVEEAIEVSAKALAELGRAGRKHPCHAGGMSITLRPSGRHGGRGVRRSEPRGE